MVFKHTFNRTVRSCWIFSSSLSRNISKVCRLLLVLTNFTCFSCWKNGHPILYGVCKCGRRRTRPTVSAQNVFNLCSCDGKNWFGSHDGRRFWTGCLLLANWVSAGMFSLKNWIDFLKTFRSLPTKIRWQVKFWVLRAMRVCWLTAGSRCIPISWLPKSWLKTTKVLAMTKNWKRASFW